MTCKGATRYKTREYNVDKQDRSDVWAAQIFANRFLGVRNIEQAAVHMCNKPEGHYTFVRSDETGLYALMLRKRDKTVCYNIRPDKDYSEYVVWISDKTRKCYESISELVADLDEGFRDYEMIRHLESNDGARELQTSPEHVNMPGDKPRLPSIHRSRRQRCYQSGSALSDDIGEYVTNPQASQGAGVHISQDGMSELHGRLRKIKLSDNSQSSGAERSREAIPCLRTDRAALGYAGAKAQTVRSAASRGATTGPTAQEPDLHEKYTAVGGRRSRATVHGSVKPVLRHTAIPQRHLCHEENEAYEEVQEDEDDRKYATIEETKTFTKAGFSRIGRIKR